MILQAPHALEIRTQLRPILTVEKSQPINLRLLADRTQDIEDEQIVFRDATAVCLVLDTIVRRQY
ncbi:hypothetical protein WK68_25900 [Burkholderia ubonensis]|nr:hypothetical protein WK68_25900 [Burkholderia ubonensis]